ICPGGPAPSSNQASPAEVYATLRTGGAVAAGSSVSLGLGSGGGEGVSPAVGGARAVSVAATSVAIASGATGGVAPGRPTGPQARPVRTTESNGRRIFRETKGLPRMRMVAVHYMPSEAVHKTRWADGDRSVRLGTTEALSTAGEIDSCRSEGPIPGSRRSRVRSYVRDSRHRPSFSGVGPAGTCLHPGRAAAPPSRTAPRRGR